jgi:nucleoside-triphosphatase
MSPPHLWVLTGERGAGKTRFCYLLAEHARFAGWQVAGLVSPAIFTGLEKTGIEVQDLYTGEVRLLASKRVRPRFTLLLGEWHFDPQALAWGNTVLETTLNTRDRKKPIDLLIIDEMGPLELVRGGGWNTALEILGNPGYRLGLVVVRPELLETAIKLLPAIQETITLDPTITPEAEAIVWWERLTHD